MRTQVPKSPFTQTIRSDATKRLLISPVVLALAGCQVFSTSHDVGLSATSVDLEAKTYYENQIMDNLIRASNGQFFVQTDLNDLGAVVENKLAGTISAGRTGADMSSNQSSSTVTAANQSGVTTAVQNASQANQNIQRTRPIAGKTPDINQQKQTNSQSSLSSTVTTAVQNTVTTAAGVIGAVGSTITRQYSGSFSPEHDNTLTMNASPVVQDPGVTNAYIQFLNLPGNKPSTLRPVWLSTDDFKHPEHLVEMLEKPTDAISSFIRSQISSGNLDNLTKAHSTSEQAKALTKALNPLLQGAPICNDDTLKGLTLPDSTYNLLSKQKQSGYTKLYLTADENAALNRSLIEAYFPENIVALPSSVKDK